MPAARPRAPTRSPRPCVLFLLTRLQVLLGSGANTCMRLVSRATPLPLLNSSRPLSEATGEVIRAWLASQRAADNRKVLLKLDFDAFNCVSRHAMLAAVIAQFPTLARIAVWCYAQPTHLQFGSARTIPSAGGATGGPPLGLCSLQLLCSPLLGRCGSAGGCGAPSLASTSTFSSASLCASSRSRRPAAPLSAGAFAHPRWRQSHLGAPIGEGSYVASHTAARAQAARSLASSPR